MRNKQSKKTVVVGREWGIKSMIPSTQKRVGYFKFVYMRTRGQGGGRRGAGVGIGHKVRMY